MLKVCQPRKHVSCCEYFPAEIPIKLNRYLYHCSSRAYYINYYCIRYGSRSWFQHKAALKLTYDGILPAGLTSDSDVHKSRR